MLDLPPEPVYVEPPATRSLFGGEKKYAAAVSQAQQQHSAAHAQWREHVSAVQSWFSNATAQYQEQEAQRLAKLKQVQEAYTRECQRRDEEVASQNAELTKLINDLAFDVEAAIQEYVGIVLANSVYPDAFPIDNEFEFHLVSCASNSL